MNMLTITAAIGSNMRHFGPNIMAPPMPMAVPMDENASLRWCHAFATTAGDLYFSPFVIVYLYSTSFVSMDAMAATKANVVGGGAVLPFIASTMESIPFFIISKPTMPSAMPMMTVARVSNLPWP